MYVRHWLNTPRMYLEKVRCEEGTEIAFILNNLKMSVVKFISLSMSTYMCTAHLKG